MQIRELRPFISSKNEKWIIIEAWYGHNPYYVLENQSRDCPLLTIKREKLIEAIENGKLNQPL
jgi:hypothetical protein